MKSNPKMWNFLLVVRNPKIKPIWDRTTQFFLRFIGVKGAARLILKGIDWGNFNLNQEIILCLGRDFFRKDIEQLRQHQKWNYVVVEGGFTKLQQTWTPAEMQIQVEHQGFAGDKYEEARKNSEIFATEILKLVGEKQKVRAILSANVDYWQDEGFIRAAKACGIPFLSLCREHAVIESVQKAALQYYLKTRHQFTGTAVAVAGPASKELMVACGSCTENQVHITGFPRLDVWRNISTSQERNLITLLTYTEGYSADKNFAEVLSWFLRAAGETPNQQFLVKCKNHDDVHRVTSMVSKVPSNVDIQSEIPLSEALPKSKLVIGFNSLALVESLLAKTPLAIPFFGETALAKENLMFSPEDPVAQKGASFFRDEVEFRGVIDRALRGEIRISEEHNLALINHFFFIDPRKSAVEYVEEFIAGYI